MKTSTDRPTWICRDRTVHLGDRPRVMGILNVTPDSFSDGGAYRDPLRAIERGVQMIAEGADILDVGGESTRPGAQPVSATEEAGRVLPVIRELAIRTNAILSVDTTKAEVARAALAAGAHIINDVSALTADPAMAQVARDTHAGVILMHRQGEPRTMQQQPRYHHVVEEVCDYLQNRVRILTAAGLDPETLAVDPGIGFGKDLDHNLSLLAGLARFHSIGRPVVIGLSRKRFLEKLTGRPADERLAGSLAGLLACQLRGVHVVRVHDVAASVDAATVLRAIQTHGAASPSNGYESFY